ncbi:helix-turn-helix domain-containing protein [Paradevosia shaoguanensis]|uniref:helix-turn-helix domain-containing protein n=1 Tax=Paradevosia shaoguanensis TaxID=1335043 RepID=UPI0019338524|nr:helix-turn-helix transcriptional regulator [Paradevosia shaoguanensis]
MTPREKSLQAAQGFAERLKAARKQAGLTQDELAAIADSSPVTLSKLETGVNSPTFEIFVALAHALNARPDYLAGWSSQSIEGEAERRILLNRLLLVSEGLPAEWLEELVRLAELAAEKKQ